MNQTADAVKEERRPCRRCKKQLDDSDFACAICGCCMDCCPQEQAALLAEH